MDNYLALLKIIILCNAHPTKETQNLLSETTFQLKMLKKLFCKLNLADFSFSVFESELVKIKAQKTPAFDEKDIENQYKNLAKINQNTIYTMNKLLKIKPQA